MTWTVEHHRGRAQAFHDRDPEPGSGRQVWFLEVAQPTLALGSTQAPSVVDRAAAERAGVAVAKRRSGGGAVRLDPGGAWWVDVIIPRADPRWDDDVSRSFHWLGRAWVEALQVVDPGFAEAGLEPTTHLGPLVRTRWSSLVCFAGLGPGEVTLRPSDDRWEVIGVGDPREVGQKLVGISQRRTRTHARFQCAVHRRFDPWSTVGLLGLGEAEGTALADVLGTGVAVIGEPTASLEDALLSALD